MIRFDLRTRMHLWLAVASMVSICATGCRGKSSGSGDGSSSESENGVDSPSSSGPISVASNPTSSAGSVETLQKIGSIVSAPSTEITPTSPTSEESASQIPVVSVQNTPSAPQITVLPSPVILLPVANPVTAGGSSLGISGTCTPLSTITLSGDDSQTANCLQDGTFSFTVSENQDNTFRYNLIQSDGQGNGSQSVTITWIRNSSVPPSPTIVTPAQRTTFSSGSNFSVAGGCIDGYLVEFGGDVLSSDITSPSGSLSQTCVGSNFSFSLTKTGDNTYAFHVTQTNPSTNIKSSPAQVIWVRDTIAPTAVTITKPSTNPYVSGDSSLLIQGFCEMDATVTLGGSDNLTTNCDPTSGTFQFTLTKAADATYAYVLKQTDLAGNASTTSNFAWTRDTTLPPTPSVTTPSDTFHYSSSNVMTISGGCVDGFEVGISGDLTASEVSSPMGSLTQICTTQAYSFVVTKSSDGDYKFGIDQTNPVSGLKSGQVSIWWHRDSVAPMAPSIVRPSVNPYTSSGDLTIQATCENSALVTVSGADVQSASCNGTSITFLISRLTDGSHTFALSQKDQAGNLSAANNFTWIRDSSLPMTPTVSSPSLSPYTSNTSTLTLSGYCTAGLMVTLGGNVTASEIVSPANSLSQPCGGAGTFSFIIQKSVDGTYNLSIVQSNNGISSSAVEKVWILDTTPPTVTITSNPTDPNRSLSAAFAFKADDPLATVQCKLNTGNYNSCSSPYTLSLSPADNGNNSIDVRAVDSAGNIGLPSSFSWVQNAFKTVALFHLDAISGPTTDSGLYTLGDSNSLNLNGTTSAPGKFGEGRTIGSTNRLSSPHTLSQSQLTTGMTVEAFVRITSQPSNGGYFGIVSKDSQTDGNFGWKFRLKRQGSSSRLAFQGSINGTSYATEIVSSSCITSINTWYHVAFTFNKGTVGFYCNGNPAGSGTIGTAGSTSLFNTTGNLLIGSDVSPTNGLVGTIDEVRLSQVVRWTSAFVPPSTAYSPD